MVTTAQAVFFKGVYMDKAQLRRQLRETLVGLSERQRSDKSKQACKNLVATEQFQNASVIMFYLALPHEVDTTAAILCAWQQEKSVAVPKVSWQQRHMIAVEITSLETGLSVDTGGLQNPVTGVPMPIEEIDLVVTPAVAYDKNGNRLGRGGGYFDRFFSSERLQASKCGFGFSEQVIESVPVTEHDQSVDLLVTDEGVINCK